MRRKLMIAAVIAAGLAVALVPTLGVGHQSHFHETDIDGFPAEGTLQDFFAAGTLDSDHRRCIARRSIEASKVFVSGRRELVDSDLSSDNGAWAIRGDFAEAFVGMVEVRATRKVFTSGSHRHVCRAAVFHPTFQDTSP